MLLIELLLTPGPVGHAPNRAPPPTRTSRTMLLIEVRLTPGLAGPCS